jgi:hypothetical protein
MRERARPANPGNDWECNPVLPPPKLAREHRPVMMQVSREFEMNHWLIALVFLIQIPVALAADPPNTLDLKAAYCLGMYNEVLERVVCKPGDYCSRPNLVKIRSRLIRFIDARGLSEDTHVTDVISLGYLEQTTTINSNTQFRRCLDRCSKMPSQTPYDKEVYDRATFEEKGEILGSAKVKKAAVEWEACTMDCEPLRNPTELKLTDCNYIEQKLPF